MLKFFLIKAQIICAFVFITSANTGFAKNNTLLTKADSLQLASSYLEMGNFDKASHILLKLEKSYRNDEALKILLAHSLVYGTDKAMALSYLEKLTQLYLTEKKLSAKNFDKIYALLGKAYFYNYKFDHALRIFMELRLRTKSKEKQQEVDEFIRYINNAKELISSPKELILNPLTKLNSQYTDHSPLITADESIIFFTSRRAGSSGNRISPVDSSYYEDIYVYDSNLGQDAQPVPVNINTEEHEATCSVSLNGEEMLIFKSNEKDAGDIYYSSYARGKWTKTIRLPEPINSKYRETHASFSADMQQIYFTSDRPGGYGGTDIYLIYKSADGAWSNAVNLGPTINTPYDEEGPYIHTDGITLYFSSKGHKSMGGFDLFFSEMKQDSTWSTPENLGYPINSVLDDIFLVPSVDGKRAYFSSKHNGFSNLYKAELPLHKPKNITMISGFFQNCKIDSTYINIEDATVSGDTLSMGEIKKINNKIWFENITRIKTTIIKQETNYLIIDSACSKPKDAKISIFQPSTKKQKSQYNIESNTGKFQFVLPPDESYLVSYQAPGYMYKTTTVNAKEGGFKHMDFALNFDTLDNDFVEHQQMVFPIAEIHLTQQSEMEMQLLAAFLKMNPHLFVDIAGNLVNADSLLSIRSNSVADALTDHGIAPENIFSNLWPSKWGTDTLQITIFSSTHPKLQLLKEQKENRKIKPIKNSGLFVENILFEKEQFTLPNEEGLTDLINYLKANPECVVMIEGHSDMQGEYKANLNLSLKRALTVWKYLINNGVGKEQLLLRPMGNIRPIAVEKDAAGNILEEARKYNRRVEFHIIENTGTEEFQIKPIQVPESYRISQKK